MGSDDMKGVVTDDIVAERLAYYKHTLYVIFHGAIAFYDDPTEDWIEAFVTDAKDDHQYLCGKFLGEVRIPAGSDIRLHGVERGHDTFANYADRFFHWAGGAADTPAANLRLDGVYSRFRFLRPKRILHCLNFVNPFHPEFRKFCAVPVFQYYFEHVDNLRLRMFLNHAASCSDDSTRSDTFNWTPTIQDPMPLTLHIRAEEDQGSAAVGRDSQLTREILGVATTPENDPTNWTDRDPNDDSIGGLSFGRTRWEVEFTLINRVAWLQNNVGAVVQNTPPGASQPFTVKAPDVFHDNNASCGSETGG
jgi:hypothetical protein